MHVPCMANQIHNCDYHNPPNYETKDRVDLTKRARLIGERKGGSQCVDFCQDSYAMKKAAMAASPATAPKEPDKELAAPV
jgi:hypothetical protein